MAHASWPPYHPRDGTADSLPGEAGADWFLARVNGSTNNTDVVNDSTAAEAVTDIA